MHADETVKKINFFWLFRWFHYICNMFEGNTCFTKKNKIMRIRTLMMIAVAGLLNFTTANAQLEGRISSPTTQDEMPAEFQKAREAQLKQAKEEKEKAAKILKEQKEQEKKVKEAEKKRKAAEKKQKKQEKELKKQQKLQKKAEKAEKARIKAEKKQAKALKELQKMQ